MALQPIPSANLEPRCLGFIRTVLRQITELSFECEMSFKFSFPAPDDCDDVSRDLAPSSDETISHQPPCQAVRTQTATADTAKKSFQRHKFTAVSSSDISRDSCQWNSFQAGSTSLYFLSQPGNEKTQSSPEHSHSDSDIIPGVYEGGFRVWDGACDLLSYLILDTPVDFKGKRVLELGCGAGLPGIYALQSGANQVFFQDYNEDVLENFTFPNVLRNISDNLSRERAEFVSGDWDNFVDFNKGQEESLKFDVLLTSDTVYRFDVMQKLLRCVDHFLSEDGILILAGKSYYFGLDGGTEAVREELRKRDDFRIDSSKEYPDAVKREVLLLKRK